MTGADPGGAHAAAARPHADGRSESRLAGLSPAYFALVMATGIVSVAAHFHGFELLAQALFVFNVAAWSVLWVLYVLRAVRHPRRFFGDMADHLGAPGYFTAVAGT